MIDFRYHLVSIIAVFLALAVGLLVGSTALSPQAETLLRRAQTELSRANATLTKDKQQLTQQVSADQAFAQAASDRLLTGLLPGDKVVLVVAPGADSSVTSGVTAALHKAGASLTGVITLKQAFMATTGQAESVLTQLAQRLAPAGLTLPGTPVNSAAAGQQAAAAVISAAILSKNAVLAPSATTSILNGFAQDGFLSVSGPTGGTTVGQATQAVLVVPAGLPVAGSPGASAAVVLPGVAQELKASSDGTVMAGPVSAIDSGGAISTEDSLGQVSTVDNADTESGAIMVAQALSFLLSGKAPAPYGIGPVAAPSPAPTPIAAPTTSTSVSPKSRSTASTGGHK